MKEITEFDGRVNTDLVQSMVILVVYPCFFPFYSQLMNCSIFDLIYIYACISQFTQEYYSEAEIDEVRREWAECIQKYIVE